jgi:hypothetical protein
MGNISSLESKHQNDICAICNKNIDIQNLLMCVRCDISFHESCYDIATSSNKTYTKCPTCNRIGCIGKFPCVNSKL